MPTHGECVGFASICQWMFYLLGDKLYAARGRKRVPRFVLARRAPLDQGLIAAAAITTEAASRTVESGQEMSHEERSSCFGFCGNRERMHGP